MAFQLAFKDPNWLGPENAGGGNKPFGALTIAVGNGGQSATITEGPGLLGVGKPLRRKEGGQTNDGGERLVFADDAGDREVVLCKRPAARKNNSEPEVEYSADVYLRGSKVVAARQQLGPGAPTATW